MEAFSKTKMLISDIIMLLYEYVLYSIVILSFSQQKCRFALLEEDFSGGELEEEGAAPALAPAPAPAPYYPYPEAYLRAWVELAAARRAAAPAPVCGRGRGRRGCGGGRGRAYRGRRDHRANVSSQS